MSTGVVAPSSPTTTAASPPEPATGEVVSSSSSLAPATVPAPPPPSDSFVGGDFLFEDILSLQHKCNGRLLSFVFLLSLFFLASAYLIGMCIVEEGRGRIIGVGNLQIFSMCLMIQLAFFLRIVKRSQNSFMLC